MSSESRKVHFPLPLFDPCSGEVVLTPEAEGPGFWVGAPTIVRDEAGGAFLLCYRRRRPRGHESDRGYVSLVAESTDGVNFETVWGVTKEELDSTSIEKSCIVQSPSGGYLYYTSYVDPVDQRWRTDVVETSSLDSLDIKRRQRVFTAESASRQSGDPIEGVKDPNVFLVGGVYHMLLSVAERADDKSTADDARLHRSSDVFNTGLVIATSALATSTDGILFQWQGRCLTVGEPGSWDAYQARLGSILRVGSLWYGFYDGTSSHEGNYEERTGLAQSNDLRSWTKITPDAPLLSVPHASGSVRYVDVLPVDNKLHYYYEVVRPDGSHDLRRSVVAAR